MHDDAPYPLSKRDQILQAAVAEFQENGYAQTSMDRITIRAGVSKRTLYKHFESKENLFRSISDSMHRQFLDGVDIQYQPGRDIRQQLTDLAWAEGRILMSPDVMAMARLVISEVLRNPDLAARTQDEIDLKQVFRDMMRDATADGQLAVDDPAEAAEAFVALIKSSTFWPVMFGQPVVGQDQMAQVIDSAVETIMCRYAVDYRRA